jgi:heat shock protein HtpX
LLTGHRERLPSCEWNLDRFEPDRHPSEFGWKLVDRRGHWLAYRLAQRQFANLVGRPTLRRRGWSLAGITMSAAAGLLFLVTLGFLAAGVRLSLHNFPGLGLLPGVPLIVLALELRPRFGRLDRTLWTVERDEAPTLFGLLDRTAAATGTRPPDIVQVATNFNAGISVVGLWRRRVLVLGLPFWASLPPQQRLALLGHELGHFAAGDPRRGLLVQPAYRTLGTLAHVFRPSAGLGSGRLLELIAAAVLGTLGRFFLMLQVLLVAVGQREAQRAEYLADEIGARIAGSAAAVGVLRNVLLHDVLPYSIAQVARSGESGAAWLSAAQGSRDALAADLPARSQLSIRDGASLFADHPPTGLRIRMLEARPVQDATLVLTEAEAVRIDEELRPCYDRCRRDLAHASF